MLSAYRLTQVLLTFSCTTAAVNARTLQLYAADRAGLTFLLHSRQANIPEACVASCGSAPDIYTQSCVNFSPSQCCSTSFELELFNCYQCIGSTQNITDYTLPQQTLDQIFVTCAAVGSPIEKVTLPGQDPNRNLATGTPSSSAPESTRTSAQSSGSSTSTGQSQSQSSSQSQQESTLTSPPLTTPSSTPRSPVTGSNGASGSSSGANASQTSNAGMRLKNFKLPMTGLGSVAGVVIVTILMLVPL